MAKKSGMTSQGLVLVLVTAAMTVVGNLMIRAGLDQAGGFGSGFSDLPATLLRLGRQPLFDLGFIIYGSSVLVWFRVLATEQLSLAYPILIAVVFISTTFLAAWLFQEPLTFRKIGGILVILFGILLVSGSGGTRS
jgi:multidrug transporter EmrE-like cation transporter